MLQSLHVKNLALIDELEISFTGGLNILSGETGAGKSVLIGSVNLALGEKADPSMIRDGAEYALIEMVFDAQDEALRNALAEMDLLPGEDEPIVLQRRIMPGRSVMRISGETVTARQMRELADHLINIHGQNDQQTLLTRAGQTRLLDGFAGEKALAEKQKLASYWQACHEVQEKLESVSADASARQREADLLRYEIAEIDEAALREGEDEALEASFRRASNALKITEALTKTQALLAAEDVSVLTLLGQASRELHGISQQDEQLDALAAQLADAEQILQDLGRSAEDYLRELAYDEASFDACETRLNLINRLKDKYDAHHEGIPAVLRHRDEAAARLKTLEDYDNVRAALLREEEQYHRQALESAQRLSAYRKKAAETLSRELTKTLRELHFAEPVFRVEILSDPALLTGAGFDEITFLVSTNPGEKQRPLQKIASGGELSRIMLGIKTVMTMEQEELAMIFDEIDAGISGKTAWKVSGKLGALARGRQVICITHLPQIAAMADTHFLIYKELSDGRNVTCVRRLDEDGTVDEIARLLGTDDVSDAARASARQMRAEALQVKAAAGTEEA